MPLTVPTHPAIVWAALAFVLPGAELIHATAVRLSWESPPQC
ncbi:MAG: hypothetical protein SYR96_23495 [Actinomycetota bacterium]|nr:hypothetical protein [Actinomycetota bacterium]